MRIWPGRPHPLGATWDGEGVNFAVFAGHATQVELCLFDAGGHETARLPLPERTRGAWHGYLRDARPGQLYGYRAHGPLDPALGHRYNPAKLLADPNALAFTGALHWDTALLPESADHPRGVFRDTRDSAPFVPKSRVVDTSFDWEDDRPLRTPRDRTVLYEAHVRNLTLRHPDVAPELRGKYLGLAGVPVLEHLRALGVTAVELMPVFQFVSERHLLERGRANSWGYSPLGFRAPHAGYASGDDGRQVRELKEMVKLLHRAGFEVILDVCYGHTAEGGAAGVMLSLSGLDNAAYYRLQPGDRRRHEDLTGCGNTLNVHHPRALQLVMDSLRYWVQDMHVDGFRFDQATILGRTAPDFDPESRFFAALAQDPVLAEVKLFAEPWDLGPGGYRLGGFPDGWSEWNDQFRDDVRRFWRGDAGMLPRMASRLSGSSDVFGASGRGPSASVNFVACHDGFTLRDVTSHERKHNEANGEGNRDGRDENFSRNWGAEGETSDRRIRLRRARVQRSLLATVAFAQGVPLLAHGDEMGRTQRGNNNAYCVDDETAWVDWQLDDERRALLDFTRRAFAIRASHPVLRRRGFFHGVQLEAGREKDITWLRPDGREMDMADWARAESHALGMLISGRASDYRDERGRQVTGATLLLLVNGGARRVEFALPQARDLRWRELLHSARRRPRVPTAPRTFVPAHSLVILEQESPSP